MAKMTTMRTRFFLALTAILIVQADFAAASEVQEFMPLGEGREWSYRITKSRAYVLPDRKTSQELVGTSDERCAPSSGVIAGEAPVFLLTGQIQETNQATGRTSTVTIETYLSSEPEQILMLAQRIQGAPGMSGELEKFVPPAALLKLPLPEPGQPYPSVQKAQGLTLDSRPYERRSETVQTPAGTFENCLRISSRGSISGALPGAQPIEITAGSIEETVWFAKGIGMVKQVQVLRMQMTLPTGQQLQATEEKTKLLTGYEQ